MYGCSFIKFTLQVDGAFQQVEITFDDVQTQTRTLDIEGICPAIKTGEQMFLVRPGDPDTFIRYGNGSCTIIT